MRRVGALAVRLVAAGLSAWSAFAVISASSPNVVGGTADEECITCHVDTFNRGIAASVSHPPFFDRGCGICHRAKGAAVAPSAFASAAVGRTGTVVTQEPAWAKRTVVPSTVPTIPTTDHTVVLPDYLLHDRYRFRITRSAVGSVPDAAVSYSLWIGLDPREMTAASDDEIEVDQAATTAIASDLAGPVTVRRTGSGQLAVHWQSPTPLFGWVELEPIQSLTAAATAGAPHPVMRGAEEAAIDVCYSCHSTTDIGTSHPVRVYASGSDIVVPEELPTVNNGMITCVTCHDPHGADGKDLVRETVKTKLCVACHQRFRGTSQATMF